MLASEALQEVREVFGRCQRRYPTLSLSFEQFFERVEEILEACHPGHSESRALTPRSGRFQACSACLSLFRQLHHEDLFLATACACGERIAWEYFSEQYLALLKRFAEHACRNCHAAEDLAQEVVTTLLGESVGAEGSEPQDLAGAMIASDRSPGVRGKLGGYNGRGSLAGWLRISVSHAAIDRFRRSRKEVSLDDIVEKGGLPGAQISASKNAMEDLLDSRWGPVLSQVLQREIMRLGARDRLLLSLYYLQEVPLKAVGRRFGVHEATASRWLERLRKGVRKRVEQELRKQHRLSARDLESLWRWVSEADDPALRSVLQLAPAGLQAQKKVQGSIG
jgi:RNA polymerase sigma factor (sigma-70 family)